MPDTILTRPTKDMVKEAMFSALNENVNDAKVLDLFAGSGALAIEALSRGAKEAYLVDNSYEAIKVINQNINALKITNAKIIKDDYQAAINQLNRAQVRFDLVFLDPPYKINEYQHIIDKLSLILSEHHVIVIESDASISLNGQWSKKKEYKYGKTWVTILWK